MASTVIKADEKQTQAFAEQFNDEAAALVNPQYAQAAGYGRGKQVPSMLSGARRDNWESLNALEESLRTVPIPPATILSYCWWPLTVNGIHHSDIVVKACPIDQVQGVKHVIRKYKVDGKELGEDRRSFAPLFPIALANEFETQANGQQTGGVVVYAGDHDPEKDPKLQEKIAAAKNRLREYATKLFQEAQEESRRQGGPRKNFIGSQHIEAAAWLYHRGLIDKKPEWLSLTRDEAALEEPCPVCKFDQNKKGALRCGNAGCGYVFDPYNAFLLGIIGPDDSKDKLALSRLSREQLDELGLHEIKSLGERVKPKHKKAEKKAEAKAESATE